MIGNLQEFIIGIDTDLVTETSPNYRPPTWPPLPDWPVVIDKNDVVVSRWSDPRWNLSPWTGKSTTLNFGDGKGRKKKEAEPLDTENANLMRMVATWLIWGPQAARTWRTILANFHVIRPIFALCNRNDISAAKLMRFPNVLNQVSEVIPPGNYKTVIPMLHRLYDARSLLGFVIIDPDGIKRLVAGRPDQDRVQTPYIPPRIWLYQVTRLRECLSDFLAHQDQFEACFHFCLSKYIRKFGSLEAALVPRKKGDKRGPFNPDFHNEEDYSGTFAQVASRFGIAETLIKWLSPIQGRLDMRSLSSYFSIVTFAGQAYVCNFTLQRREEVASLRTDCLLWDEDEKLGRVPIICGETTKTDTDSDARWIASPSVEAAIQALSAIARVRMTCDSANPAIQPTTADQENPYLSSTPTEPWGAGLGMARPYNIRSMARDFKEMANGVCAMLFDPEHMKITVEDANVALRLTPNLPLDDFGVGKVWPLAWHQYRRTGAVNMFASGEISDSTMQHQLKHCSRLMPLYYGRNHGRLHFNKEVQAAVVMAMYQAQAETLKVVATEDRFMSPHAPERRKAFAVNVLSAKDTKDLMMMAKKGVVAFREHRLGGCMKAGVCEYGGIESITRCAGGSGRMPCTDVLYDRRKEPQIRADVRRLNEELKMIPAGQPRANALLNERKAMESYLNAISEN